MSSLPRRLAVILSSLPLAACMTMPARDVPAAGTLAAAETITLSVGPCFGFCPVYTASISPAGAVRFNGERHTAVLGERTRTVDIETYRRIARRLAGFRPADGATASVECSAAVSDTSTLTITWTAANGGATSATVTRGCPGGRGHVLAECLDALPAEIGIGSWMKQTTRTGVSRG